jgi:HK97 family phage major capsid protein
MNPLAFLLAVLFAFAGWLSTDSGEAGASLAVAGLVVSNRRRLQDEASKIHADIEALRSAAPESDQEQADNLGRLGELEARADSIAQELERENATDARLARLRTAASNAAEHRGSGGSENGERPQLESFGNVRISDEARAHRVGSWLRDLRDGRASSQELPDVRTLSEGGSAGSGPEFGPATELYSEVVNMINRQSLAAAVAFTLNTNATTVSVPKLGLVTADFVNSLTAPTAQDPTTSAVTLNVYDAKVQVDIENNLLNDSPIDVAGIVSQATANANAKFMDSVMFAGHAGKSIAGLYAGISSGRKRTVAAGGNISATDIGVVMGSVDPMVAGGFSWAVSGAGWGQLCALEGGRYVVPMVGGNGLLGTIWGVPVYKTDTLPSTVLAVYGAFRMTTAIAMRKELSITPLRELKALQNTTVFLAHTRFGLANHEPAYAGAIIQG